MVLVILTMGWLNSLSEVIDNLFICSEIKKTASQAVFNDEIEPNNPFFF